MKCENCRMFKVGDKIKWENPYSKRMKTMYVVENLGNDRYGLSSVKNGGRSVITDIGYMNSISNEVKMEKEAGVEDI